MSKQTPNRHLRRDQLERYLRQGDSRVDRHLAGCEECRTAVEILKSSRLIRMAESDSGHTEALIQRLASIPTMASRPARRPIDATSVSDSWHARMAASVRHAGQGIERRLRYRARDLLIDLVIDRLGDRSECFLRVSRHGRPVPHLVLNVGSKDILPSDIGFFSWTGNRPPRRLTIWSTEICVKMENIQW